MSLILKRLVMATQNYHSLTQLSNPNIFLTKQITTETNKTHLTNSYLLFFPKPHFSAFVTIPRLHYRQEHRLIHLRNPNFPATCENIFLFFFLRPFPASLEVAFCLHPKIASSDGFLFRSTQQ